uniref:Uncharacterized protein n=1 Tax=Meleagris gallopavo TaxID=9103 RepID=A0A803YHF8_MELGA
VGDGVVGFTLTSSHLRKFKTVFLLPYFLGNISVITLPVSSTNSPTKILPKTLGPINVNVGPQMSISTRWHHDIERNVCL